MDTPTGFLELARRRYSLRKYASRPVPRDVIERCLTLWSNPGDIVLSPFAGIGSEIYQAIKMGRVGIGIELKKSYFDIMIQNCEKALHETSDLFS